jgi:hypothetical protein
MKLQLYALFTLSMVFILSGFIITLIDRSSFVVANPFLLVGMFGTPVTVVIGRLMGRIDQLEKALADRSAEGRAA